ncbi:MAG: PPC domain-containing protein [Planctomycetes bacterium]|nr:PPC domain-containing protein [Planctomycetota bacterium]
MTIVNWPRSLLTMGLLLSLVREAPGQNKKPEKQEGPKVVMVLPLGVVPGAKTRITIRGLKLDAATQVRFPNASVAVKVLGKGKAPAAAKEKAAQVGDTQVEAEVTVPAGTSADTLPFVVVTPAGETPAHLLLVESRVPVVPEKEPNNSFPQAQAIQVPQVIEGVIQQPQDVDVFRLEGQAGQRLILEVLAARYGSALDSLLTLYDAHGHELAESDDSGTSTDSRLEFTLPSSGTYYLSVMDASDQGGPTHPYWLKVLPGK